MARKIFDRINCRDSFELVLMSCLTPPSSQLLKISGRCSDKMAVCSY